MFLGITTERRRRIIRNALATYLEGPAMLSAADVAEVQAVLREITATEHLYDGRPPTDSSDAMPPHSEEA